ncbi:MAG: alpha/beta fold hydrolase [Planctomycetota bacterium]
MKSSDGPSEQKVDSPKRKTWRSFFLKLGILLVVIWFGGDFAYSCYVRYRIQEWESKVPWTEDGFTQDAKELEGGEGQIALLMVHGFNDTPQMYRKLLPELKEDYHCKAILLPGFGRDVATYAASTKEEWLTKVDSEVQQLRQGHEQVWIVAHSLGGAITINHVLNNPESVDGVVLLAPAIEVSSKRSPMFSTRFWHEFNKIALPSTRVTCSPYPMDAKDEQEQERELRNIFSPTQVVDNTFQLIDANRGRAKEISIPALVILATDDTVVDSPAIESFYEGLGSSKKKLVKLDNSGHMVPVDFEWQDIVAETRSFVSGE